MPVKTIGRIQSAIVSLQNDNPINKAKYAKMVDSAQSVRGAISQYAANAQAHDSVEEDMKNLVNNYNKETGTGILKPGKEVKNKLGVDPTSLQKEGDIIVHVATGRTEYQLNTDAYNDQIKEQKPEGIKPPKKNLATNLQIGSRNNFSADINKEINNGEYKCSFKLEGVTKDINVILHIVNTSYNPYKYYANDSYSFKYNNETKRYETILKTTNIEEIKAHDHIILGIFLKKLEYPEIDFTKVKDLEFLEI